MSGKTPLPLSEPELEATLQAAGKLIAQADFVLISTGAGWSADSGININASKIPAYAAAGLDYKDLCNINLLSKDPELFYGFWGGFLNNVRETKAHRGHEVLRHWYDSWKKLGQMGPEEMLQKHNIRSLVGDSDEEQPVGHEPFFVLSTNFDGHFHQLRNFTRVTNKTDIELYDPDLNSESTGSDLSFSESSSSSSSSFTIGSDPKDPKDKKRKNSTVLPAEPFFPPNIICEMHGNVEVWQCSDPWNCTQEGADRFLFKIPEDVRFTIDPRTRRAPVGEPSKSRPKPEDPPVDRTFFDGFDLNHPKCPRCARPARPSVYMCGGEDYSWIKNPMVAQFRRWRKMVEGLLRARLATLVVVEIGAGERQPALRNLNEEFVQVSNTILEIVGKRRNDPSAKDKEKTNFLNSLFTAMKKPKDQAGAPPKSSKQPSPSTSSPSTPISEELKAKSELPAVLIRINPEPGTSNKVSDYTINVPLPAEEALTRINKIVHRQRKKVAAKIKSGRT